MDRGLDLLTCISWHAALAILPPGHPAIQHMVRRPNRTSPSYRSWQRPREHEPSPVVCVPSTGTSKHVSAKTLLYGRSRLKWRAVGKRLKGEEGALNNSFAERRRRSRIAAAEESESAGLWEIPRGNNETPTQCCPPASTSTFCACPVHELESDPRQIRLPHYRGTLSRSQLCEGSSSQYKINLFLSHLALTYGRI